LPRWSSVIDGPKIFYPDAVDRDYGDHAAPPSLTSEVSAEPEPNPILMALEFFRAMEGDLKSDLRRSRIRKRIWISVAALQAAFLVASFFKIW
ncbi:MAG: hypothetical protein JOY93_09425, partial [Acidobacteriales bacterium]|nr:hypothetical protein [Terriglobales bacterium]